MQLIIRDVVQFTRDSKASDKIRVLFREDIYDKTETETSCEKCNSKAFRLGIVPASSGLLDQCIYS